MTIFRLQIEPKLTPVTSKIATTELLEGKLTVKHWLRKDLPSKEVTGIGEKKYPIYVRVRFQRKQKDFPSQFESIYLNVAPKRIPLFPVEQLLARLQDSKVAREYFTEREFHELISARRSNKQLYPKRLALEEEYRRVMIIAELLRRHNFNYAEMGDSVFIQDQLTHPIAYALDFHFKKLLSDFILKHRSFKDGLKVNGIVDWRNPFVSIYPGLLELANESFVVDCIQLFSQAFDLYHDVEAFTKASGVGVMCFEWAHADTLAKFNEHYDTRIKSVSDAVKASDKVEALYKALANYFSNLGELGSRLFRL